MRLDPDQLEWIVREVVRRLREETLRSPHLSGDALGERKLQGQGAARQSSDLTLSDRVVTLSRLDGKLNGIARLHVARRAVVTPAVRDLLKERSVELVRESKS